MIGNFQEIGPCQVVEADQTHLKTTPREYGWDRISNLLFIDQVSLPYYSVDGLSVFLSLFPLKRC